MSICKVAPYGQLVAYFGWPLTIDKDRFCITVTETFTESEAEGTMYELSAGNLPAHIFCTAFSP